jgi:hypothetical protein
MRIYGNCLERAPVDLIGRLGRILSHHFYIFSCFLGFLDKINKIFTVANIYLIEIQSVAVSMVLIIVLYLLLYFKTSGAELGAILVGYFMAMFLGAVYLVN